MVTTILLQLLLSCHGTNKLSSDTVQCRSSHDQPWAEVWTFTPPLSDEPLMEWEEAQAREAWPARFGEPMPPSERGKHPGPHRTVRVPVMLTPAEAARLDEIRGEKTRSDYLRQAIQVSG